MANQDSKSRGSGAFEVSAFKAAAIGAPIAIGGGIGVSRYLKTSSHFGTPVQSVPFDSTQSTIRAFRNKYVSPAYSGVYKDWQQDQLGQFAQNTQIELKHTQSALYRATGIADPSGRLSIELEKKLGNIRSSEELLRGLSRISRESSSYQMSRAVSSFLSEYSILQERVSAGLPIETSRFKGKIPRLFEKIDMQSLSSKMQNELLDIEKLTGAKATLTRISRKDLSGAMLRVSLAGGKLKHPMDLNVPMVDPSNPAIITKGATQQSRYIAGYYGRVEGTKLQDAFNHSELFLNRAKEELIPDIMKAERLNRRRQRSIISAFEQKMIESPEWIPSLSSNVHSGISEYSKLRSQIVRLMDVAGNPIDQFDYADILKNQGVDYQGNLKRLFPGASPGQIGKSVMGTFDPRAEAFLVPEAANFGRRPLQWLRANYAPTKEALAAMSADPFQWRFGQFATKSGVATPMVQAMYLSPRLDTALAGTGISSEGQGLIVRDVNAMRKVEQWKQMNIASNKLVDLKDILDDSKTTWSLNEKLQDSKLLGYSPEGKPVIANKSLRLVGATAFENDPSRGDFIRVMGMQELNPEVSKVFGGTKGMMVSTSQRYADYVLKEKAKISDDVLSYMSKNVDAIVTMKDLKAQRALHYNQMFTALWDFTSVNIQSGRTNSKIASNFANNPHKVIANMRKAAMNGDHFSHEKMLYQIHGLARTAKLESGQMGLVFGAVPDVFGLNRESFREDWARTMMAGKGMTEEQIETALSTPVSRGYWMKGRYGLSALEATQIQKGIATGVTQLFFEGEGAPGAGRMGSIEPRAFELLGSSNLGSVGSAIQTDITNRMLSAYPERIHEQNILQEALSSVVKPGKLSGATTASDIIKQAGKNLLPTDTTNLTVAGLGDIYIPGAGTISQIDSYRTGAGNIIDTPLANAYRNMLEDAQALDQGKIRRDVFDQSLDSLRNELTVAYKNTITGPGGVFRNKLPGSRSLTAIQALEQHRLGYNTVGITKKYADQMFDQMAQMGIHTADELEGLRKRFESGGKITGVMGRHPYIGPYGSMPVNVQMVAGEDAIAVINERLQRVAAFSGQRNQKELEALLGPLRGQHYEKVNRKIAAAQGEMLSSPIRLSPIVGAAGDFDGDAVSIMLAGPQLDKTLTSAINDKAFMQQYEEYAIRSQILKAKATASNPSLSMMMAGDATKLGITKGGQLGKVSAGLQQYRNAILMNKALSREESMSALGLLEWLEQTPISGKHIAAGREEEMIHLLDTINEGLQKKDANAIADATRAVMSKSSQAGQDALNQGLTVAMEDLDNPGRMTVRHIRGLEVQKTSNILADSMRASEVAQAGKLSAAKSRHLLMRAKQFTQEDSKALLNNMLDSPFASLFSSSSQTTNKMASLSTRTLEKINKVAATGKGLISHARPLMFGTAAALGVAAVLSSPPSTFSSPGNAHANMTPRSGGSHTGNVHPDHEVHGAPTVSDMTSSANTARLAQPDNQGYRINIRGETGENVDMGSINAQIKAALGGRASINSSIKDTRNSLTPQKLSSLLNDN